MPKEIRVCPLCSQELYQVNWFCGSTFYCYNIKCACNKKEIPYEQIKIEVINDTKDKKTVL